MAVLSSAVRLEIRQEWADRLSQRREAMTLTKADIDAAIAALDDWQDANAAAVNAAIPLPARTALTQAQKAEIFALISARRYGVQAPA